MEKTNFSAKADDLVAQAEKKLKGGFFKNLMSSKNDRLDEAKELYSQAANCYKLCQQWEKATECYLKCIECEPEESDHATYYLEAAHSIKKVNTNKYLNYAKKAIGSYCLGGRVSSAASLAKECAEKLEEDHDYEEAIKFYERAAELYFMEETPTYGNQALVKASDLVILTRDYASLPKAIKNYEKVGKKYLSVPLIKSNAKDLFFKAALCYLANDDLVGAKRAIQHFQIEDPNFDGSREHDLLNAMIERIEARDEGGFSSVLAKYMNLTPFDKVKTQLVVKIKEIYLPTQSTNVAVGSSSSALDFTGGADTSIGSSSTKGVGASNPQGGNAGFYFT